MTLRSAYFPDFKGGPTLLFWGDAKAMSDFSDFFRDAGKRPADRIALAAISEAVDGNEIFLQRSSSPLGLTKTASGFDWILDTEALEVFSDLVAMLATSSHPSHQYLDDRKGRGITAMVSRDEYPDNFRPTALPNFTLRQ